MNFNNSAAKQFSKYTIPVLAWYHYLDTIWQKTLRHSQFTKSLKTVKRKTTS